MANAGLAHIQKVTRWERRIVRLFKQRSLWAFLEYLFQQTLCTQPDGNRFQRWAYWRTGLIAGHFHRKHCITCQTNSK